MTLGASGLWLGIWTGAGVAEYYEYDEAFGRSPWLHEHRRQHTGKVKSSRPSLEQM